MTPKRQTHVSFWEALTTNKGELLFAAVLLGISLVLDNSPLPTLFIVLPCVMSVYLTLLANVSSSKRITSEIEPES